MSDRLVLKVAEIPAIDAKNLRVDELYLFYHLFRYVEVGAGQPLEEGRVRLVWQDKRKKEATGKIKEIRGSLQAFKILEPPNNDLTRAIASVITLKEHIFFSNRAVEWYSPYDDTAHLNQSFADTRYRLNALFFIRLVGDMLTAPIVILKTFSLKRSQH